MQKNILQLIVSEQIDTIHYSFWGDIKTSVIGYETILQFFNKCKQYFNKTIILDFSKAKWFDANMSANLILFCKILKSENNISFEINDIQQNDIHDVLWRNNFFNFILDKEQKIIDEKQSTISLGNYDSSNSDNFVNYIEENFINHRSLIHLTNNEKINLRNNYFEIFDNIDTHANSSLGCFVCGQMYPQKNLTKFSIVDYGDGFLNKIKEHTKHEIIPISTHKEAILWALRGNTTKIHEPGGTGLSGILKYCYYNKSSLQIISGDSFFEFVENKKVFREVKNNIKGTTINLILKY